MFRTVSLVALFFSLAFDLSSAVGVAHSGTDTSVGATGTSVTVSPTIDRRAISEPSVLLLVGLALITVSRAARR